MALTKVDINAGTTNNLSGSRTFDLTTRISGSFTAPSSSFSTRVSNLKSDSGSFSTRVSNLKSDSGSFSTRVLNLKSDSGSISTRLDNSEASGALLNQDLKTSASPTFTDITATGQIVAKEIYTEFVSASVVYSSGSNIFGDTQSDIHQMTGSLLQTGSFTTTGDITATGDITVTGQDVQTGANNYLHLGDDSRIVSIGQGNEVNFLYDTNSDQSIYLNYSGYNGGTTRFRNTVIGDGKNAVVATFTGDGKSLEVAGQTTINTSDSEQLMFKGASSPYLRFYESTSAKAYIQWHSDGYMRLANDEAGTSMVVGASGIGIGTTSPGHMLEVSGSTGAGGIVEQGGVLKENLIKNSGFSVWSQSDVLAPTGSNLIENSTFANDDDWVGSSATITDDGGLLKVTATAAWGYGKNENAISVTPGHLYELRYQYKNTASEQAAISIYNVQSTGNYPGSLTVLADSTTMSSVRSFPFVVEQGNTSIHVGLHAQNNTDIAWFDNVTLYEVIPGITGSNTQGPDGWFKEGTTDCWRIPSGSIGGTGKGHTKAGSYYSMKVTAGSDNDYLIYSGKGYGGWTSGTNAHQEADRLSGRATVMGVWAKTDTASHARIQLQDVGGDRAGSIYSDYHTGGGDWEWLEVSRVWGTNFAERYIYLRADVNTKTVYYSQPMLAFGYSLGEGNTTQPPGEIIWCSGRIDSHKYDGFTLSADNASEGFNIEADTKGKLPKGIYALHAMSYAYADAAGRSVSLYNDNTYGHSGTSYDNSSYVRNQGWIPFTNIDAKKENSLFIERTGTWTNWSIKYKGVQLL